MSNREGNEARVAPLQIFTSFLPLCLMAISLALFFGWQVTVSVRQYITLLRLGDQQVALSEQAAQTEGKLQALIMDLLKLSKTDTDAKTVIDKYGIKFNTPPQPGAPSAGTLKPQPRTQPPVREGAGVPKPQVPPPDTGADASE
ncbi:MAG: hypothetical protein WCN95_02435 [bacterium]